MSNQLDKAFNITPEVIEEEKAAVLEVLDQEFLGMGTYVKKFEEELYKYFQRKVVCVNTGTSALQLALQASGIGPGDEVLVQSLTYVASFQAITAVGAKPVPCEIKEDLTIDLTDASLRMTSRTRAIMPVHYSGAVGNLSHTYEFAKKHDLVVVEDAAHALETISNHGKVGNTDYAAAFSFYANKNITTGGEGGALATNDKVLAENIRKLSLHGMSKDGWKRFQKNAKWEYDVSKLGYKYNMTDISASFGNWQMKYVKQWHASRSKLFKYYNKKLSQLDGITCPIDVSHEQIHGYHLYIIRLKSEMWSINRNKIIELLNASGIGTSVHYKPIHMHSYYQKKYGFKPIDFPNSYGFYRNAITLPLYPDLSIEQVDFIVENLILIWNKYKN